MSRGAWFVVTIVLQLLVFGLLVGRGEHVLRAGQQLVLETGGYDPVHPLAGRFLDLRLTARSLDREAVFGPDPDGHLGDTIFVWFERSEDVDKPVRYAFLPPAENDVGVLRGTLERADAARLGVSYGMTRFFIPNDGDDPTREAGHVLRVVVRVGADRRGLVEDLLVDGKPYALWNAER